MKLHDPATQEPFWYISNSTVEEFILGMLSLGYPLETSLVGNFDEKGRGSRRDIELPLHQDGDYSKKTGSTIEKPDIVGFYCIRGGSDKCITLINDIELELKEGNGLVFDNKRLFHGRKGKVGNRILFRIWIKRQ